jgi:hypothetical protein
VKALLYKLFLIFIAVAIGFEIIFGLVFPKIVLAGNDSYINRWRQFYTKSARAGLVCLGSSRAEQHCNPEIISGITHLKTEVIAESGAKIDVFENLYADYLGRNPRPAILLIDIDFTGLDSSIYLPFPEQFFPFITTANRISNMPEFNIIKYHKPLGYFYFKERYINMLAKPERIQHVNGFLVRDENWDSAMEDFIGKYPDGYTFGLYLPTLKKIFGLMARERSAGVQCLGFIAPEYYEVWKYENNRAFVLSEIFRYADSTGIRVLNFSDSSYKPCFNKDYFYNSQHLNSQGSAIFSRDLADSVLRYCSTIKKAGR